MNKNGNSKGHYMNSGTPTFRAGYVQKWLTELFGWEMPKHYYALVYQDNKLIRAWRLETAENIRKFETDADYRSSVMSTPTVVEKANQERAEWLNETNEYLTLAVGLKYGLSRKQTKQQRPTNESTSNVKTTEQAKAVNGGNAPETANILSSSEQRAIRGLKRSIAEHEKRLAEYISDPDASDNKGFLKSASPEVREKIIKSRIEGLKSQIRTFEKDIEATKSGTKEVLEKSQPSK